MDETNRREQLRHLLSQRASIAHQVVDLAKELFPPGTVVHFDDSGETARVQYVLTEEAELSTPEGIRRVSLKTLLAYNPLAGSADSPMVVS